MADTRSTPMPTPHRDTYQPPLWRINLVGGGSKDVHAFGLHPSGLVDIFDDEMGSGAQPVCHIGPTAWLTIEPIAQHHKAAKPAIDAGTLLQDTVPMHRQPQPEDSGSDLPARLPEYLAPSSTEAHEGEPDGEYSHSPVTGPIPTIQAAPALR